jgi:proteasome accessory factor A
VICFDNTLAHVSSLLKVGTMQVVLAMIEAGWINPNFILDDPVEAVVRFSHDPTLQAKAPLASGRPIGAVELQRRFLEEAVSFAASGGLDDVVPRAQEILALWEDTLVKLEARDLAALAPRLDWVLKLHMLERAMRREPALGWESSQIKRLDHLYSSLAPDDGLYWAYERGGFAQRVVTEEQIRNFLVNPPADTRAFTRATLLRSAPPGSVESVDWDSITFKFGGRGFWPVRRTFAMANPLGFTKAEMAPLFAQAGGVEKLLDAVEASGGQSGEDGPGGPPGLVACRPQLPRPDSSDAERSRDHEIA